jgi:bacillolysin
MRSTARALAGAVLTAVLAICAMALPRVSAQDTRVTLMSIAPDSVFELREADQRIDALRRAGELRQRRRDADTMLEDREHERLDQYYRGVRVWGGDVTRQLRDGNQTVSAFGQVYDGLAADTTPEIDEDAATRTIEELTGSEVALTEQPELVILPQTERGSRLAWRLRAMSASDIRVYFVDARTAEIAMDYSDLQTQAPAIGRGTGVLGDTKKVSARTGSGGFLANDAMRPPTSMITYDLRGNFSRTLDYLNGRISLANSDIAIDTDNIWTDGAIVDAHVYAGFTYDYYYKRFNRRGLNDANITSRAIVHPANRDDTNARLQVPQLFANAVYIGGGVIVLGEGLPSNVTSNGRSWNFTAGAIDIVAHELTHGVTDFTSDLIYLNESGALNESFSDMMGTAVEFFFQQTGSGDLKADYLCAEDVVKPVFAGATIGIRSLADPAAYGHPDHYSKRFLGSTDNGGVHTNSGISNHAFYLAIEGGTNRTSGLAVQGVGASNRDQIEKVFYRAFTQLMPSNSTFSTARAATIQAARDLYGANSAAERAVTQAWTAVGVQ